MAYLMDRQSDDMIRLSGGTFEMGSTRFYPEERPVRSVAVKPFRIDLYPVTNAQFAQFVAATGHITVAEKVPNAADYPGMLPEMAKPGSLVFEKPRTMPTDFAVPT